MYNTQTQQPINKKCLSDLSLGGLFNYFPDHFGKKSFPKFWQKRPPTTYEVPSSIDSGENTSHPVFNFTYPPVSSLSSGIQFNQLLVGFFGGSPKAQRFELRHRCVTWRKGNSNGGRWMATPSPSELFFCNLQRLNAGSSPRIGGLVRGIPSKMPQKFRFRNCSVENGIMFEREVTTGGTSFSTESWWWEGQKILGFQGLPRFTHWLGGIKTANSSFALHCLGW